MKAMQATISYYDLTENAQKTIDRWSNDSIAETWFAKPHGRGFRVIAIQDDQIDLARAQGMDGWRQVEFSQEEESICGPSWIRRFVGDPNDLFDQDDC